MLKLILKTCRFQVEGLDKFVEAASKNRCIVMFWHNQLAITPEIFSQYAPQFNYTAFVSKSRDGEVADVLANSYKIGSTIRVPHNNKSQALHQLIDHLKYGKRVIVITPDGPRGPIYQVKPGIAVAAKEAKASVVPLKWSANRYWEFKTWDRMKFPKPFSTIHVTFRDPITKVKDTAVLQDALSSLDNNGCCKH